MSAWISRWVSKQSMGTKRQESSSNCWSMLLKEDSLHNFFFFFSLKEDVRQKSCKPREMITRKFYRDSVLSAAKNFYKKVWSSAGMGRIKLLHDNAPAHKSHLVQEYLAKENAETLPHPAYSLDLAPYDLFLFPHLKKYRARRSFKSRSALGTAVFQYLMHIPQEAYQSAFLQWIGRLLKCVAVGECFEKLK